MTLGEIKNGIPLLSNTKKAIPLKNLITGETLYDRLHLKCDKAMSCEPGRCVGSFMGQYPKPKAEIQKDEILKLAHDFYTEFFEEKKNMKGFKVRWDEVVDEIERTGIYEHTYEELEFGAKLAWRNAPRCPGRIQWRNLHLFDFRKCTSTDEIFAGICEHIDFSTNGGNIRPAISTFPPRSKHLGGDFRIWNKQLLSYACFKSKDGENEFIGDKINYDLTSFILRLGWKPKRTQFDILPIVLSGPDGEPKFYEIPEDIILRVKIRHPTIAAIEELDLEWFALPAVSGMMFEIGGIQFPACPFSGWYSLPEIASRDLLDMQRYDLLTPIGELLGLDLDSNSALWKDRVNTEVNVAVMHSFVQDGVSIVDQYTQADQFMSHLETEHKVRGGCPSDWVWIVPPESGSLTPLFHQEMLLYHLTPGFEYQNCLWENYRFPEDGKKKTLQSIIKSSLFTSSLYAKQMSKRPKAVIVYGTETGASLKFAKKLQSLFTQGFNAEVFSISDLELKHVKQMTRDPRSLLLLVSSTFGNGDPPQHAQKFHDLLMKTLVLSKSSSSSLDKNLLSGLKYAVFALGSTAYPKFCAFGKFLDETLFALGGERVQKLGTGDDQSNQVRSFNIWAKFTFYSSCKRFNVSIDKSYALDSENYEWSIKKVPLTLPKVYNDAHGKKIMSCELMDRSFEGSNTLLLSFDISELPEKDVAFEPGDHFGVFPQNPEESVLVVLGSVRHSHSPSTILKLKGQEGSPTGTLKDLLTYFCDISSTPQQDFLNALLPYVSAQKDVEFLKDMSTKDDKYKEWKRNHPTLMDVFVKCSSLEVDSAFLIGNLGLLQPRWYSIASAPIHKGPRALDLVVSLVEYYTPDGTHRKGLCTHYLNTLPLGSRVYCCFRAAPSFKLPKDSMRPIIMIAAGSGIAPFKGFWEKRSSSGSQSKVTNRNILIFGCTTKEENLFATESDVHGVLRMTAFSRNRALTSEHVQDIVKKEGPLLYEQIVRKRGYLYVCGKVNIAEDVRLLFVELLIKHGGMESVAANKYFKKLKDEGRYGEDIFGLSYSTEYNEK